MKDNKLKFLHIILIIIGAAFILSTAFHSDIWFDESYSVAIAKHNFVDIYNITGHDVHPPVYYWMLHVVFLIFGNNVMVFRLFSVLAIILLGILGYTHIRKDFGEKVGIFFSFLTFFLPVMSTYSQEIRMYSWGCLIISVMTIYAYRFYINVKQNESHLKNLIIFGIFSILACYLHYYALATAALVNLILLIYVIRKRKDNKKALISFLILAGIEVIAYIPWLIFMTNQVGHVKNGFWIVMGPVNTTVEVLSFQFRRQLDTNFSFNTHTIIALAISVLMYIYLIFKIIKEKKKLKFGIISLGIYIGVILIVWLISFYTPILFSRYLMIMTGLYIFGLAYIISTEKKKWVTIIICSIIVILALISNITNFKINYDSSNMKQIEYLKENIKEGDILVYSNIGNGGVIAAFFPEYKQYFYNGSHWEVEEAYKAYGPGMETVRNYDFLNDYKGRIWIIDSENMGFWNEFPKENINILLESKRFDTKYQNYIYSIMLVEKGE